MMKNCFLAGLVALSYCLSASAEVDESPIDIKIVPAFTDLEFPRPEEDPFFRPVVITHAKDGTNRLFFVSQQGSIYAIDNRQDVKTASVLLDIEDRVHYNDRKNEEGLLGLAFHPDFKSNGYLYVYYTTEETPQTSIISRFTAADGKKADPNSEVELMRIKQPFWNHNGGSIEFGPDGYLYIGLGDGGAANDTLMNGQNVQTLLGSILRIDVDRPEGKKAYGIPDDNPFASQKNARQALARPEIYAYGLRNVWRLAFDAKTGALWVSDVGQNLWEEINIIEKGGNYGWNLREGNHRFGPAGSPARADLIDPIWEYDHEVGKSITGGQVYRGSKVPSLAGYYLYADYVSSRFWALKYDADAGKVTENRSIPGETGKVYPVTTFGIDAQGEVYCADYTGKLYRFESKQ